MNKIVIGIFASIGAIGLLAGSALGVGCAVSPNFRNDVYKLFNVVSEEKYMDSQAQIAELNKALAEYKQRIEDLTNQLNAVKEQLSLSEKENAELKAKVAELEDELAYAYDTIMQFQSELDAAQSTIAQLVKDLQASQQELANAQARIAELEQQLAQANARIAELEQQIKDLQAQLNVQSGVVTSASMFTFSGDTLTGYVGDKTVSEITIPRTYSIVGYEDEFVGTYEDFSSLREVLWSTTDTGVDLTVTPVLVIDSENVQIRFDTGDEARYSKTIRDTSIAYPVTLNISKPIYGDGTDYAITRIADSDNDTNHPFANFEGKVILQDNIIEIGERAFSFAQFKQIDIPNSVTKIGTNAFAYSLLEEIVIPNSVTEIWNYSFSGTNLKSIVIPSSVTFMNNDVFKNCPQLESVILHCNLNESCSVGSWFDGVTTLKNFVVEPDFNLNLEYAGLNNNDLTYACLIGLINNLKDRTGETVQYTFNVGEHNLAKLSADELAILTAKNWLYK